VTNLTTPRIEILLVEDDPGDVVMTREALDESDVEHGLTVAEDGVVALDMLFRRGGHENLKQPDLVVLDLNLPRVNGFEVLDAVKSDPDLRRIPVIVLTTSSDEEHILNCYDLHANAYVNKPVDFDQFLSVVKRIDDFFVSIVRLPSRN
jgi:CheY-like chemotaxis protein